MIVVRKTRPAMTQPQLGWTLAFTVAAILPFYNDIPFWPLVLFLTTAIWRWHLLKRSGKVPHSALRFVWTLANAAYVFFVFGSFNGIEPGSSLLIVMAAMKLMEARTPRDLLVLIYMSFFLILTNFLFDQSLPSTAYSIVTVWLGLTTITQVNRKSHHDSIRVALKESGLFALQALPLTLILFFLFPRVPGPFWALPSVQGAQTGLSETMEPGSISQLLKSSEVAFRAYFDGQTPARRELYWRGPVLENVDGRLWTPRTIQTQSSQINLSGTALEYEMVIEPHRKNWLLALDMPDPRRLPRDARLTVPAQLLAYGKINERRRVGLSAYTDYVLAPNLDDAQRQINLDVASTKNPDTRRLAAQWQEQTSSNAQIVDAALLYFNQQPFVYTLSPPQLRAQSNADQFLFETRRGFCEHYASSFVLLMRYAGIPARVVTGYMGGEYNEFSQHFTVRQSDAHAWAEVWLANRGWVRVDPTGAVAPERVESGVADALPDGEFLPTFIMSNGDFITSIRQTLDAFNANWNNWVLGYGRDRQWALLSRLGITTKSIPRLVAIMISIIAVLLLLYAAWLRKNALWIPSDPIQRLFMQFKNRLNQHGVPTFTTEDAMVLATRAGALLPEHATAISRFCTTYQASRYGSNASPEDLNKLKTELAGIPRKWPSIGMKTKLSGR